MGIDLRVDPAPRSRHGRRIRGLSDVGTLVLGDENIRATQRLRRRRGMFLDFRQL